MGTVEAKRRAGVDHRGQAGFPRELLLVDPARDPGHLDTVQDALAPERIGMVEFVGQANEARDAVEMTGRGRQIHRLHGIASEQVNTIERLAEADQIVEVRLIAGPPPAGDIGDVGGAGNSAESQPAAADLEIVLGVACVKLVSGGRLRHALHDQCAIEAHPVCPGLDIGASVSQKVVGAGMEKVHPDLFEDGQRRVLDRGEAVFIQNLDGWKGVFELPPGPLVDLAGAFPPVSVASSRPRHRHHPLAIQVSRFA